MDRSAVAPTEAERRELRAVLERLQTSDLSSSDAALTLSSRQLQTLNVQAFFEERFSDTDSYQTKSPFDPLIPPDSPPLGETLRVGALLQKLPRLSIELDERSYQVDVGRFSGLESLEIRGKFAPQLHLGAARLKVRELKARYPLETAAALLLADADADARARVLAASNEIVINLETLGEADAEQPEHGGKLNDDNANLNSNNAGGDDD